MRTKISINYINLKVWLFPAVMLISAIIAFPFLPDEIARQWDSYGNVANMSSKWIVFLPTLLGVIILIKGNIIPFIDPKHEGYGKIQREYNMIHFMLMVVLLFGQTYMILSGLGVKIPLGVKLFSILIGLFFVLIGNILPKIPPTYLTGIKTVWAYGNDEIWTKTQRFSSRIWVLFGIMMIFTIFLPWHLSDGFSIIVIIAVSLLPRVYSMILHYKS